MLHEIIDGQIHFENIKQHARQKNSKAIKSILRYVSVDIFNYENFTPAGDLILANDARSAEWLYNEFNASANYILKAYAKMGNYSEALKWCVANGAHPDYGFYGFLVAGHKNYLKSWRLQFDKYLQYSLTSDYIIDLVEKTKTGDGLWVEDLFVIDRRYRPIYPDTVFGLRLFGKHSSLIVIKQVIDLYKRVGTIKPLENCLSLNDFIKHLSYGILNRYDHAFIVENLKMILDKSDSDVMEKHILEQCTVTGQAIYIYMKYYDWTESLRNIKFNAFTFWKNSNKYGYPIFGDRVYRSCEMTFYDLTCSQTYFGMGTNFNRFAALSFSDNTELYYSKRSIDLYNMFFNESNIADVVHYSRLWNTNALINYLFRIKIPELFNDIITHKYFQQDDRTKLIDFKQFQSNYDLKPQIVIAMFHNLNLFIYLFCYVKPILEKQHRMSWLIIQNIARYLCDQQFLTIVDIEQLEIIINDFVHNVIDK